MPAAKDITIAETLTLLDADFAEFAAGIADDKYALWLGAGISRSKLPGLDGIIERVLEHVRQKVDPADATCRFRQSLENILGMVVNGDGWKDVDYSQSFSTWKNRASIVQSLTSFYARMLDEAPAGEEPDYLVWDALDVVAVFANPAIDPGPEHLAIVALVCEGAASEIVSANWDPLIERALEYAVGNTSGVLQVRVLPADVQDNTARAHLYKFHGCAALAEADEPHYRDRIVGRQSQIHGWAAKGENKVIAHKLVDLAISKPTLMLGLSAQDTNIQSIFVEAHEHLPATFPTHPPAIVLSENMVGVDQRSLLRNFYKTDYTVKREEIEVAALVRSFGQSLLPALWLHVVTAKLQAIAQVGAAALPVDEVTKLKIALARLRDQVASAALPDQQEAFMRTALPMAGRGVNLFRNGKDGDPAAGVYTPFSIAGAGKTLVDPNLPSSGLPQAAVALGLLGLGVELGLWTCTLSDPTDPKTGAIRLNGPNRSAEVFFAANAQAASRLVAGGHVADDDEAIVIHSHELIAALPRHPRSPPGRTLNRGRREISVSALLDGATGLDGVFNALKAEVAL